MTDIKDKIVVNADMRSMEVIKRTNGIDFPSVVEIGVYRGMMSQRLLHRPNLMLTMIDPWGEVDGYDGMPQAKTEEDWEDVKTSAINRVKWASDRVRVYQGTSDGAATHFDSEKFDLVFIDGDHSYEQTSKDIKAWWELVADGGYLGGHDYREDDIGMGVVQAVNEFAEQTGLDVELGQNHTWFVWKPE